MKRHLLLWAALIVSAASFGQSPVVLKDSGLKKLAVFIGTWKAENDPDSSGATGASGGAGGSGGSAVSAVYTCQWSANGNYLVADQQVMVGGNTTNNLSIYNYNSKQDTYTLSLVGVPGMQPFSILVTYKGDELYYLSDYTDNSGKKMYNRTVNSFLSPNSYTFKV
jgi:hypothetical protein